MCAGEVLTALLLHQVLTAVRECCPRTREAPVWCATTCTAAVCRVPIATCAATPPVDGYCLHPTSSLYTLPTTTHGSNRSLHCFAPQRIRVRTVYLSYMQLIDTYANIFTASVHGAAEGDTACSDGTVCTDAVTPSGRPSLCNPAALAS